MLSGEKRRPPELMVHIWFTVGRFCTSEDSLVADFFIQANVYRIKITVTFDRSPPIEDFVWHNKRKTDENFQHIDTENVEYTDA